MISVPNRIHRIPAITLVYLLLVLPLKSFAEGINTPADTILAILQPDDAVPKDAVKLREVSLTGNNYGQECGHYELLLQARRMAVEAGANVLKIKVRTQHSRTQRCDGLELAFYLSPDPRSAEQSFVWNAARPLSWDDFAGPVRAGSADHTAAETNCGIAVETNLASSGGKARVYVFNTFDKRTSWVRPGKDLPDILAHEQVHWDICELYTRRMQARFDKTHITGATLKRKVNEIYQEVSREYEEYQEQYEQETQHGTIAEAQQRWARMIAKALMQDI